MDETYLKIVICPVCQSVATLEQAGKECPDCGAMLPGPLRLPSLQGEARYVGTFAALGTFMKPLADDWKEQEVSKGELSNVARSTAEEAVKGPVICGWCATRFDMRPNSANCPNCGGPLPKPPGNDPGQPPCRIPRHLPRGFTYRLFVTQNRGGWFGMALLVGGVGFALLSQTNSALLLLLSLSLGGFMAVGSFLTAYRRRRALLTGVTTLGIIEAVQKAASKADPRTAQTNPTALYLVYFRFEAAGELLQGCKSSYDPSLAHYLIGEPVWVVYVPEQLAACEVWPPLA